VEFLLLIHASPKVLESVPNYNKRVTGKEKGGLQPSTESTDPHCTVGYALYLVITHTPSLIAWSPRITRSVSPDIGARIFSDRNETESDNDHPHTPS
jgi:hypothetical protein